MPYVANPNDVLLPGLCAVEIVTKNPNVKVKTYSVSLAIQDANPPSQLLADLAAEGFGQTTSFQPAPAFSCQGVMVRDMDLFKAGTGLFNGWTADEAKVNIAALKRVFKKNGLKVTPRTLTMAECI